MIRDRRKHVGTRVKSRPPLPNTNNIDMCSFCGQARARKRKTLGALGKAVDHSGRPGLPGFPGVDIRRTAGPCGCLMPRLHPVPNRRLLMLAAPVELALPPAGALSAPSRPQRMPNAALALRAQLGHAQLPPRAQAAHAQLVPGAAGGSWPAGASGGPCQAWRADKGRPLETPRARFTCWKQASGNLKNKPIGRRAI